MTRKKSIGLGLIACVAVAGWPTNSAAVKAHTVNITGRLRTDGVLTVRQQETVLLKDMPRRLTLSLAIAPPQDPISCFDIMPGTCLPTPLYPAPGTPSFRTSGRGRAALTFVMPESYKFMSSTSITEARADELLFRNGQVIYIRARGMRSHVRSGSRTVIRAKATGGGTVEVPP